MPSNSLPSESITKEQRMPEYEDQIVCPYCGHVDYDSCDYPNELKQDGDDTTVTCNSCGRDHNVIISISIAYLSGPIPEAPSHV